MTARRRKPWHPARPAAASLPLAPLLVACAFSGLLPSTARAIITLGENEDGRNLAAPAGLYAESGWQYQGLWGGNVGTAIGPRHFLTARHVGGSVGDIFRFAGRYFVTIDATHIPDCDLTVWAVAETLPRYAPLYEGRDEMGREAFLVGRGTTRGAPVVAGGRLHGWRWGPKDGRVSWGVSRIVGAIPPGGVGALAQGEKLVSVFNVDGGPNEGCVSTGDSGGGVFVREEAEDGTERWALAGILYGTGAQYAVRYGNRFETFSAAIYDPTGLWRPNERGGYVPADQYGPLLGATLSYATRVSPYAPAIRRVLNAPPRRRLVTRRRAATLALGAGLMLIVLVGHAAARRRGTGASLAVEPEDC